MAPPYLCGLKISLLCHQLVRIVLTLFLSIHSFMLLHANGQNWVNISGHQILIVSGRVLKQCYLHNNMDADCKCIYCYLWCDHSVRNSGLGPIQFVKIFTVIGPSPPVHIWFLTSPWPFHLRHVRHIPSQILFSLSKTEKSLTNTSNASYKTKPHVLYVFVNKLWSEVSHSYECIQKYIIAYSNIFSTFV